MEATVTTYYSTVPSPVDELLLTADGEGFLTGCFLAGQSHAPTSDGSWRRDPGPFGEASSQLEAYFAGERTVFDLPLRAPGTGFQTQVWRGLRSIPFATTVTYGELARTVGHPRAHRAVGSANGRNPLAVIVPCHRVVAAGGRLGGYGGGTDRKRRLLDHEFAVAGRTVPDWR